MPADNDNANPTQPDPAPGVPAVRRPYITPAVRLDLELAVRAGSPPGPLMPWLPGADLLDPLAEP